MTESTDSPAATEGGRPSTGLLLVNAVSLFLVVWFGVSFAAIGLEVREARVVALNALPFWPFYALAAAVAAGLGVFVVVELIRRRPQESRSYRLLPITAIIFLAMHFLVLPPAIPPAPSDFIAASQLLALEDSAVLTDDGLLPADPAALSKLLTHIPPPYLRDGERMTAWPLVVRADCDGPITELPAGIEPATLLACLSPDRRAAWLSMAGTGGEYAGPAAPVIVDGKPFFVQVRTLRRDELPTPMELNAGTLGEGPVSDLPED